MSKIRVLHYSTHDEDCGIGKYQEQFIEAMAKVGVKDIYNEFFTYSPNVTKVMSYDEFTPVLQELRSKLESFDILHIQHELSFYKHDELGRIVKTAHDAGKIVVFTVHTAPDAQYHRPQRHGYGPRSIIGYVREMKAAHEFTRIHIDPMKQADLILVHNTTTKTNLVQHGVLAKNITPIRLPVPDVGSTEPSNDLHTALQYKEGDIIIGAVGFISRTKGVASAIRALNFLPSNYKLALIGGVHPSGAGEDYLEEITDFLLLRGLKDRVYITGYVEDDDYLNSLISECDVCVYPYDRQYYKYASSAALNNAIANYKPVIAYPTETFVEMNQPETIAICRSANYYELARYILEADYKKLADASKEYATAFSYPNEAKKLITIYKELLRK